jgi:hypothetical protein
MMGSGAGGNATVRICGGNGVCLSGTGTCRCFGGYGGDDCGLCADGYMRLTPTGKCVFLAGALSSCHDGVRSSQEDGVDCGGVCDTPCSHAGSAWSQYRVIILASSGGVAFVALGVAALLMYRVSSRRENEGRAAADALSPRHRSSSKVAAGSPERRQTTAGHRSSVSRDTERHSRVKKASDVQVAPLPSSAPGTRRGHGGSHSASVVRAKPLHVRPWAAGSGLGDGSASDSACDSPQLAPSPRAVTTVSPAITAGQAPTSFGGPAGVMAKDPGQPRVGEGGSTGSPARTTVQGDAVIGGRRKRKSVIVF